MKLRSRRSRFGDWPRPDHFFAHRGGRYGACRGEAEPAADLGGSTSSRLCQREGHPVLGAPCCKHAAGEANSPNLMQFLVESDGPTDAGGDHRQAGTAIVPSVPPRCRNLRRLCSLNVRTQKHDPEDNLFGCSGSPWYCNCRQCGGYTLPSRQDRQPGHKSCGRMRTGKLARPEWTLQFPGPSTCCARSLPGGILLGPVQPVLASPPLLTSPDS